MFQSETLEDGARGVLIAPTRLSLTRLSLYAQRGLVARHSNISAQARQCNASLASKAPGS